jgi:hypothetical protein
MGWGIFFQDLTFFRKIISIFRKAPQLISKLQWALPNGITLGQTDSINQMIPLTETHFAWLIVLRPNRPLIPKKNWSHSPNDPINCDPIKQTPLYKH